jgi:glycosyltransferase involved in cell wall biosynthesis
MGVDTAERQKLTVIVLSFNVEDRIEDCLTSVGWADEVLVVDSFSTDRTVHIAAGIADRVVQHEYVNYAAQHNWAIPQAKYEWVLIVDSDEQVTPELRQEVQSLLRRPPEKDGYLITRDNYLMGRCIKHAGWGKDRELRLFRRDVGRFAEKRVHAPMNLKAVAALQGRLKHDSIASMAAWVAKINRYSSWKAADKFEKQIRMPVLHLVLRPPLRFIKDFVLRGGILDGWRGFLISAMAAFSELIMAAKLTQKTYAGRPESPNDPSRSKH